MGARTGRGWFSPANEWRITLRDGAALLTLALAIRWVGLGAQPLWNDELFTAFWSRLSSAFLLGTGAHIETNPPYYYLLMHFWIRAFGSGEFSLRFPPMLFSASTVVVVYAIGATLIDRPTARIGGVFACCNPASVYFAQEARSYALVALLDGVVILALAKYEARRRRDGRRSPAWLLVFVGASVASFCAHYTSLFFIAAAFIAIAARLATTRPLDPREMAVWAATGAAIALALLAPASAARTVANSASIAWINPPSWSGARIFLIDSLLAQGMFKTPFGDVGAILIVSGCAIAATKLDRWQSGPLIWIPVAFCLLIVGSSFWRPILVPRVSAWLAIPVCLLLARLVTSQATFARGAASAAVALFIFVGALGAYFARSKEDWRGAARMVASDPRCGGPIVFGRDSGLGLVYYQPSLNSRSFQAAPEYADDARTASFALAEIVLHPAVLDAEAVPSFVRDHPRAALVLRSPSLTTTTPFPPALARAEFTGELTVACF